MKQRCVLILITNVTKVKCTYSLEVALFTEHDYKIHQRNVHRDA
jgi:hypothetical protein